MQPRIGSPAPIVQQPLAKPTTPVVTPKAPIDSAKSVQHTQASFNARSPGVSKAQPLDAAQDSQTLKASVDQMNGGTVSEIVGAVMANPDIAKEFAPPSPVKGVLALGGDDTVLGSAFSLSQKSGHTSMTMRDLGRLTSQDKLTLVGHGDADTFGGMKAEALVQQLKDAGVTQLGKISLKGCNSAKFAQQLFAALQAQGIEVGSITGRTGDVAIAQNGRTLVSHDAQLLHQAQGSKFEVTASGLRDVYADHSADFVQTKSQQIESLGHSGKLGLEKEIIYDLAKTYKVEPPVIGRMADYIDYAIKKEIPKEEIIATILQHEKGFPKAEEAANLIIENLLTSKPHPIPEDQFKIFVEEFEEAPPLERLVPMANFVKDALIDGRSEEYILNVIKEHDADIPNIDEIARDVIANVKKFEFSHIETPKLVFDESLFLPTSEKGSRSQVPGLSLSTTLSDISFSDLQEPVLKCVSDASLEILNFTLFQNEVVQAISSGSNFKLGGVNMVVGSNGYVTFAKDAIDPELREQIFPQAMQVSERTNGDGATYAGLRNAVDRVTNNGEHDVALANDVQNILKGKPATHPLAVYLTSVLGGAEGARNPRAIPMLLMFTDLIIAGKANWASGLGPGIDSLGGRKKQEGYDDVASFIGFGGDVSQAKGKLDLAQKVHDLGSSVPILKEILPDIEFKNKQPKMSKIRLSAGKLGGEIPQVGPGTASITLVEAIMNRDVKIIGKIVPGFDSSTDLTSNLQESIMKIVNKKLESQGKTALKRPDVLELVSHVKFARMKESMLVMRWVEHRRTVDSEFNLAMTKAGKNPAKVSSAIQEQISKMLISKL